MKTREQLQAELDALEAANEAATGWGAAVGARSEMIKGIRSQLNRMPATDETRQSPAETVSHASPGRQWIIDLVREQFDKAPDHYRLGDSWDDGAPAIADAIFAQLPLLMVERQKELAAELAAEPGLTTEEMQAQAKRCSCRGSDDYCTCQNVPDHATRAARQLTKSQRPESSA